MTTLLDKNKRDDATVIEQNIVPAALAAFNPETSSLTNDIYVGDTFADAEGLGINATPPLHPSAAAAAARDRNAIPLIPPRNDPLLEYIANHIMRSGHKHRAQRIVANTLAEIHRMTGANPLPILRFAITKASPSVRVSSMKRGAKTRLVPVPLADKQRTFYAVKWILKQSDKRGEQQLAQRLAKEIIAIIDGSSRVLNQKAEVHKVALANRYDSPFMNCEQLSYNTDTGLLWVFGLFSFLTFRPSQAEASYGINPCILVLSIQSDPQSSSVMGLNWTSRETRAFNVNVFSLEVIIYPHNQMVSWCYNTPSYYPFLLSAELADCENWG